LKRRIRIVRMDKVVIKSGTSCSLHPAMARMKSSACCCMLFPGICIADAAVVLHLAEHQPLSRFDHHHHDLAIPAVT
jgi:hypothetical protein